MNRKLANTAWALLLGLIASLALAGGVSEKLDRAGFLSAQAQPRAATQRAWGEMWLTEGDDGVFSMLRQRYTLTVLEQQPAAWLTTLGAAAPLSCNAPSEQDTLPIYASRRTGDVTSPRG